MCKFWMLDFGFWILKNKIGFYIREEYCARRPGSADYMNICIHIYRYVCLRGLRLRAKSGLLPQLPFAICDDELEKSLVARLKCLHQNI